MTLRQVLSRPPPVNTRPVNLQHFLGDAVGRSVVQHRLPAGGDSAIVIHDQVAADRKLWIKVCQAIYCRFVHIPVEPNYRQPLNGRLRKSVSEPTF